MPLHDMHHTVRTSPFPPVGSPELGRIHRETQAALDRRLGNRQRPSLRVQLAQALRRITAKLDP